MAAYCTFHLNRQKLSTFTVSPQWSWSNREQRFPAFSGTPDHRNDPESASLSDKGPIPPGTYYIVDRDCGGLLSCAWSIARGRHRWFALYRDDGWVDDRTWIDGVQRGEFRLHPGPGTSRGCVTVANARDFDTVSDTLKQTHPLRISGVDFLAYGTLFVWRSGESSGPVRIPPQLKM